MCVCDKNLFPNEHFKLWINSLSIEEKDNLLIAVYAFKQLQKLIQISDSFNKRTIQETLFLQAAIYSEKCEEKILEILEARLLDTIRNIT